MIYDWRFCDAARKEWRTLTVLSTVQIAVRVYPDLNCEEGFQLRITW